MRAEAIIDSIWALPRVRVIYENNYINMKDDVITHIQTIVDIIASEYDFGFALDVGTVTTVSGTNKYEVTGNNNNCRDIINVRYGDGVGNDKLLEQIPYLELDRRNSETDDEADSDSSNEVTSYYLYDKSDNGFPYIYLSGSPTESGKTITYRYRKNDIVVFDVPDMFRNVVVKGVLSMLIPQYENSFTIAINRMKRRFMVGGDNYATVRLDPVIWSGNKRRAGLYGQN